MSNQGVFGLVLAILLGLTALTGACGSGSSDDDSGDADDDQAGDDDDAADDDAADDDDDDNDDAFTCNTENSSSTIGLLFCRPGAYEGYTLFAPTMSKTVYLIDMFGQVVNTWLGDHLPGQVVYLLEDGRLLRTGNVINFSFTGGGQGGNITLQQWDGTVDWSYQRSTDDYCLHHDVKMLPNGDILAIQWEKKSTSEAVAAGRNPNTLMQGHLWVDAILEIQPVGATDGEIVWEWHAWDHLIQDFDASKANYGAVAEHPELIDLNCFSGPQADWLHTNSVDYNEQFDQIMISVHEFSEIWVIDHSTTTAEAAGHTGGARGRGGDLLYRWGNPAAYRAGDAADRFFYYQHDGQWIADGLPGAGDMMVFNNGNDRPEGQYSTVDEWAPPVSVSGDYSAPAPAYGPDKEVWTYKAETPSAFFSHNISGAQRLANGNTLVCSGDKGTMFETTDAGELVWEYINPVTQNGVMDQGDPIPPGVGGDGNMTFRAYRYPPDYPGFDGKDLTPGECLVEPCE
jgi:hypothetical protein